MMPSKALRAVRTFQVGTTSRWLLLSAVVGVVAGLGGLFFLWLGQAVQHHTVSSIAGYPPSEPAGEQAFFPEPETEFQPWLLLVVMSAGGLVSGWLVFSLAPEAEGHGTDAAIDSFHNKRGEIRGRIPIVKTIASAVTLGTGGSAGREGPIAQIGAGFGSILATRLRLPARDRRILLAAGMGAGVGAIFRAPLAGALFAGEILYRDADLEADVIMPAAVSSTTAFLVYSASLPLGQRFQPLFGEHPRFQVPAAAELLPYTALAVCLVLAGLLYVRVFYGVQTLFKKIPVIPHVKPMIGAALAALIGLAIYHLSSQDMDSLAVLGSGYGTLQKAFSAGGNPTIRLLVSVALVKIVTTSLTISSGGSGGVFGPSMVIGGCLGAAIGQLFSLWLPGLVAQPQAFGIVGMAGFFAGCARAPFSTILMVTEMTGGYQLLWPTMWVSALCFALSRWTLYDKQVPSRLQSPAHRGDFIIDVLEGLRVKDVYRRDPKLLLIHEGESLDEIVHHLGESQQRYFPVVDHEGAMVGIFSAEDVRSYLYDDVIWRIANARDVMNQPVISVTPGDDLNTALTRFTATNIDELPVVDPDDPTKLLGMLRRKETIAAYNRRRLELKKSAE